jgi:hypothetical protein
LYSVVSPISWALQIAWRRSISSRARDAILSRPVASGSGQGNDSNDVVGV